MNIRTWPVWAQVALGIIVAVILLTVLPFALGFCRVLLFGG